MKYICEWFKVTTELGPVQKSVEVKSMSAALKQAPKYWYKKINRPHKFEGKELVEIKVGVIYQSFVNKYLGQNSQPTIEGYNGFQIRAVEE